MKRLALLIVFVFLFVSVSNAQDINPECGVWEFDFHQEIINDFGADVYPIATGWLDVTMNGCGSNAVGWVKIVDPVTNAVTDGPYFYFIIDKYQLVGPTDEGDVAGARQWLKSMMINGETRFYFVDVQQLENRFGYVTPNFYANRADITYLDDQADVPISIITEARKYSCLGLASFELARMAPIPESTDVLDIWVHPMNEACSVGFIQVNTLGKETSNMEYEWAWGTVRFFIKNNLGLVFSPIAIKRDDSIYYHPAGWGYNIETMTATFQIYTLEGLFDGGDTVTVETFDYVPGTGKVTRTGSYEDNIDNLRFHASEG